MDLGRPQRLIEDELIFLTYRIHAFLDYLDRIPMDYFANKEKRFKQKYIG